MTLSIFDLLINTLAAVLTVTLHEYTKALTSTRLGDTLPKRDGRLSFNPMKQIEPLGFLCFVFFGFGWGKTMATSSLYYQDRRKGTILTYAIPSVINVIVGLLFYATYLLLKQNFYPKESAQILYYASRGIYAFANMNICTALFNMIPIAPADASKVGVAVWRSDTVLKYYQREKMLQLVLLILIFTGILPTLLNVCSSYIIPVYSVM